MPQELSSVAYIHAVHGISRVGTSKWCENDCGASERIEAELEKSVLQIGRLEIDVTFQAQEVQQVVFRTVFLPCFRSGQKKVRILGLEHSVRLQRHGH